MYAAHTKPIQVATPSASGVSIKGMALAALNWLASKDQAYRNSCDMADITDETLNDVGLTRDQIS